jgi:cation transport ATPase
MSRDEYSNEEMQAILTRAMRRVTVKSDKVDRKDLESAASELGISQAELARAIAEWERDHDEERTAMETRKKKRAGVVMHGVVYVFVITGLFFHMSFTGMRIPIHWVILGWGIGLIGHILQGWFGWEFEEKEPKKKRN